MRKRRLKLKSSVIKIFKLVLIIIFVGALIFGLNEVRLTKYTKIGYSKEAIHNINKDNRKFILEHPNNKTLNKALESSSFKNKYISNYARIKYFEQEHLIENINSFISKGYTNTEISMILEHGNDKEVSEFTKKKKVNYIDEFLSISYAKLNLFDRYMAYSDSTGEDGETTVLHVNLDMDREAYVDPVIVEEANVTMLVNKRRMIKEGVLPLYLVDIPNEYTTEKGMKCSKLALDAYYEMLAAAKTEGLDIIINSAYRSREEQQEVWDINLKLYGENYVNRYVSKPGFSEHETGLAFDFKSTTSNIFGNSKEYPWMIENSYKYGFILRYTKENQHITGYRPEPWHYRFVGKSAAKVIHDEGLTLEEYYAKYLDK